MGTTARFTIKYQHLAYNYYVDHDGYLSGAGDDLCDAIRTLSQDMSLEELRNRIMEMDPQDGETDVESAKNLYELIGNLGGYITNNNEDYDFCYVVDFDRCELREMKQTNEVITFTDINRNMRISGSNYDEVESESESEESEEESSECEDGYDAYD